MNKFMEYIIKGLSFKFLYWFRIGLSLFYIGVYGFKFLCFYFVGDVWLFCSEGFLECFIFGYCFGIILIFVYECFCVVNFFIKKFCFFDYYFLEIKKSIGFVVD